MTPTEPQPDLVDVHAAADALPIPLEPSPRADAAGPGLESARLAAEPAAIALGRHAASPAQMPWLGWKAVLRRTFIEMLTDRISLVAAGCAFYGTLALFPAISMLISIYGMVFDPVTVEPQLEVLRGLLPGPAYTLIDERIHLLVSRGPGSLGLSLLFSTAITLWSSATGVKSILTALNIAYEEKERRSILQFQVVSFTITLIGIFGTVVGLGLLVGLPAMLTWLGFASHQKVLIRLPALRCSWSH